MEVLLRITEQRAMEQLLCSGHTSRRRDTAMNDQGKNACPLRVDVLLGRGGQETYTCVNILFGVSDGEK